MMAGTGNRLSDPGEVTRHAAEFLQQQGLTQRETQVATMIFAGMKNLTIASHLNVSEATVRLHITNIHRKLNTANKVDLVLKAFGWWIHHHHNGMRAVLPKGNGQSAKHLRVAAEPRSDPATATTMT